MSKQTKRIFDCRPLIEEILHRDIDKYEPCDDGYDRWDGPMSDDESDDDDSLDDFGL